MDAVLVDQEAPPAAGGAPQRDSAEQRVAKDKAKSGSKRKTKKNKKRKRRRERYSSPSSSSSYSGSSSDGAQAQRAKKKRKPRKKKKRKRRRRQKDPEDEERGSEDGDGDGDSGGDPALPPGCEIITGRTVDVRASQFSAPHIVFCARGNNEAPQRNIVLTGALAEEVTCPLLTFKLRVGPGPEAGPRELLAIESCLTKIEHTTRTALRRAVVVRSEFFGFARDRGKYVSALLAPVRTELGFTAATPITRDSGAVAVLNGHSPALRPVLRNIFAPQDYFAKVSAVGAEAVRRIGLDNEEAWSIVFPGAAAGAGAQGGGGGDSSDSDPEGLFGGGRGDRVTDVDVVLALIELVHFANPLSGTQAARLRALAPCEADRDVAARVEVTETAARIYHAVKQSMGAAGGEPGSAITWKRASDAWPAPVVDMLKLYEVVVRSTCSGATFACPAATRDMYLRVRSRIAANTGGLVRAETDDAWHLPSGYLHRLRGAARDAAPRFAIVCESERRAGFIREHVDNATVYAMAQTAAFGSGTMSGYDEVWIDRAHLLRLGEIDKFLRNVVGGSARVFAAGSMCYSAPGRHNVFAELFRMDSEGGGTRETVSATLLMHKVMSPRALFAPGFAVPPNTVVVFKTAMARDRLKLPDSLQACHRDLLRDLEGTGTSTYYEGIMVAVLDWSWSRDDVVRLYHLAPPREGCIMFIGDDPAKVMTRVRSAHNLPIV